MFYRVYDTDTEPMYTKYPQSVWDVLGNAATSV